MSEPQNKSGQCPNTDRHNPNSFQETATTAQSSHAIPPCQWGAGDYRAVRARYLAEYLGHVSGLPRAELVELEIRQLTAARHETELDARVRCVLLAIACRAQLTRGSSNAFTGYFPKAIFASVNLRPAERVGLLSLGELTAACHTAAAMVGWEGARK